MLQAPSANQIMQGRPSGEVMGARKKQMKSVVTKTSAGAPSQVSGSQMGATSSQGLGSRFRVAVPMQYQNQTKSTVT